MIIYEIDTGSEKFYCRSTAEKNRFVKNKADELPVGTTVVLKEMAEEEFNNIPATQKSYEAFN